jgi:hypothetical protein
MLALSKCRDFVSRITLITVIIDRDYHGALKV